MIVETRRYPQGAATLVAEVTDGGRVVFSIEPPGAKAGVSAQVIRQLADASEKTKGTEGP